MLTPRFFRARLVPGSIPAKYIADMTLCNATISVLSQQIVCYCKYIGTAFMTSVHEVVWNFE